MRRFNIYCLLISLLAALTFANFAGPSHAEIPSDGLVAYYPFNGNANDESGNANHGTVHGATLTEDRLGNANSGYYFDGTNDYIEGTGPGTNFPTGSSPRTISAWTKSNDISVGDRNIFHYGTREWAPTNFHLLISSGGIPLVGNGYGYGVIGGSTAIDDSTWHHIVGIYEGPDTNTARVYVDGVIQG